MRHFRYLLIFFYSINTSAQLNIEVTFEDPIEFESQLKFIEGLDGIDSVKSLKNALENQEWIDRYILNKVPFDKNIVIKLLCKLYQINYIIKIRDVSVHLEIVSITCCVAKLTKIIFHIEFIV